MKNLNKKKLNNCIIIPARLNSSRIFQKPLVKINNEYLIVKTYKNVIKHYHADRVYIATDSKKVVDAIKSYTKNYILIKRNFINGAERCSYSIDKIKNFKNFTIVSCDMPFLNGKILKYLENKFLSEKNIDAATVHTKVNNRKQFNDPSIAKIVISKNNRILYISRSNIPSQFNKKFKAKLYTHHGLMMFKRNVLSNYKKIKNSNLQLSEDNEWLKLIENDFNIKSYYVKKINSEINTKSDLAKLIKINK